MPEQQAAALRAEVAALTHVVGQLASRSTVAELVHATAIRTRRFIAVISVLLLAQLGVTGYLMWTNVQISVVQQRTSNQVLCPLYEVFLRSYHPEAQPPARRVEYEESFAVIRKSYAVLECQ